MCLQEEQDKWQRIMRQASSQKFEAQQHQTDVLAVAYGSIGLTRPAHPRQGGYSSESPILLHHTYVPVVMQHTTYSPYLRSRRLMACKLMLVLFGLTYPNRLWCAWKLSRWRWFTLCYVIARVYGLTDEVQKRTPFKST